jgi:hypothetical protein
MEVVARPGDVIEAAPERERQLGHAHVELVDELRADAAEAALARPAPELTALQQHDVGLAALREEVRGRGADDATADDDGAQGSSSNV